ncbi:protein SINE4-like [Raphanus sativus]|uniref:Protein SINE4-like n=1 Tax=Raphanus sativus TaxID=3726 RepID=A0A6J0NCQ4_RAPSA|nr:protein SINE4-like [Raphanus sativus]
MEEREENPHERLKHKLSELEKVWTAMKDCKNTSAGSCITVEEALKFVESSPRKLMISLQHDQDAGLEAEMRSPYRRKLFHDSDDDDDDGETRTTTFSHSTCWSSNVMKARDNSNKMNKKHEKKNRWSIVCVSVIVIFLWVLVVLINGFVDQLSMNGQINTLIPT